MYPKGFSDEELELLKSIQHANHGREVVIILDRSASSADTVADVARARVEELELEEEATLRAELEEMDRQRAILRRELALLERRSSPAQSRSAPRCPVQERRRRRRGRKAGRRSSKG